MKWLPSRCGKYHLVINKYYACNKAVGHYRGYGTEFPLPSMKQCCKNCLLYARKRGLKNGKTSCVNTKS